MQINSYNKYQANTIKQLDSVQHIDNINKGSSAVDRVDAVKQVTPGFNSISLYLFKLSNILKNEKEYKKNKKKKIKYMTLEEFKAYISSIENDFIEEENLNMNMNDEQILFMQDMLSQIEDSSYILGEFTPVIIDEDINTMNLNQFKEFLKQHTEIINITGIIHYQIENIDDLTEDELLKIKILIDKKIKEVSDLFYYNKAFNEYEKSYDNMAYVKSEGISG